MPFAKCCINCLFEVYIYVYIYFLYFLMKVLGIKNTFEPLLCIIIEDLASPFGNIKMLWVCGLLYD